MTSNCSECGRWMEWPRQCSWCHLWYCDICGPVSSHDCTQYEPTDEDDEFESEAFK